MKRERDNVVVTITVKAITKQKQLTTYTSADYKPFIQNNPNPILKNKIKFISNKQFKLIIIFNITFSLLPVHVSHGGAGRRDRLAVDRAVQACTVKK